MIDTIQYILKQKDGPIAILFVLLASSLAISVLTCQFINWFKNTWSFEAKMKRQREQGIEFLKHTLKEIYPEREEELPLLTYDPKINKDKTKTA